MKKGYLICLFCFITVLTYSQNYFELTPNGFVDRKDTSKNYIVINFEGKSQQELYDLFLVKFTSLYVSPNNVISGVPNSTISINGISTDGIKFNQFYNYNLNYTIVFQFKDGKVRINSMSINKLDNYIGSPTNYKNVTLQGYGRSRFLTNRSIFDLNGELYDKELKEQLEVFYNNLIGRILSAGSDDQNW